ncbi:MAG: Phosphoglycerate kinase [Patescibacteria group bacterium]|nr:Phosphoglycerate kinase [Patescibacteria group bacterium]
MTQTAWANKVFNDSLDVKGKRVLVRLDLNIPVENGVITDTTRMDAVIPFLTKLSFAGAKLVLLSHFGEKGESLEVVGKELSRRLSFVSFVGGLDQEVITDAVVKLREGDAILLENVRLFPGETENVTGVAQFFASLGDLFINDAFSVSHRKHASVVGIPQYLLSFIGPTCARELTHLSLILSPKKPALLIIGGAKISTKLSLINRYLDQGVGVFVGGAMVHNIFKARGLSIGQSLFDKDSTVTQDVANHPNLLMPIDVILSDGQMVDFDKVPEDGVIVDCGDKTLELLKKPINEAETIIMNGPLGLYEKGWLHGTESVLTMLGSRPKEVTYIGGGDTVAAAGKVNSLKNIGFVSLGGGAMLDFLASGTLVGIDAVTKQE